ncbi:MAG: peptidoglycan DD-metalloendopeptidase family protein [Alphaproteobacteria bacterium]|nr:peptidoglycan DD-metalloendopeptidase family protein [Alphaproteobacteria bacterium]MCZ6589600.1 peptidoglycan DD-metalloendopeptidase family protein [Alphaproteobacteria bacterium]
MPRVLAILVLFAGVAVATPWGGSAWGADDPVDTRGRLDDVHSALERDRSNKASLDSEALRQAGELGRLRTELSAAAAAAQAQEAAITSLEIEVQELAAENHKKVSALTKRKGQLGYTLAALQRMSLRPASALIVSPGDLNDVIRSGLLLRTAVPQIEAQTKDLKSQLAEIAELRREMAAKREKLQTASLGLTREQDRLSDLAAAKNRALKQTEAERKLAEKRIAKLVAKAKSLEELLEQLSSSAAAVPRSKPQTGGSSEIPADKLASVPRLPAISAARGRLTRPAQGAIIKKFGARTSTGGKTRGVTWQTRIAAVVVAPWEGRVVFAGRFRNFGRILIIDHGEGYHSLIAGLGRLDAHMNQWVLAGEPVGVAGGETTNNSLKRGGRADKGHIGGSARLTGGATLYVELRRDGQPINPLPWMTASTDRTRG